MVIEGEVAAEPPGISAISLPNGSDLHLSHPRVHILKHILLDTGKRKKTYFGICKVLLETQQSQSSDILFVSLIHLY